MSGRHLTRTRVTLALVAALADGRLVVGPDGSPPTTELPPDEEQSSAVRRLEDRLGLSHDAMPRMAACDLAGGENDTVTEHRIMWRGPLPASWTAPTPYRTVPVGQALAALRQREAGRVRAACRAGLLGDTVRLHCGRRPGIRPSKAERTGARFAWHPAIHVPEGHPVRQVWGWLTDPDGRVLVLLDRFGAPSLPGGQPEPGENWADAMAREAAEESSACLGAPVLLGFQQVDEHNQAPYAQLRMTAPLLGLGPAAPDPDSGETYRRVLVPARQANLLLGWGPEGDAQVAAVTDHCRTLPSAALRCVPERGWAPASAEEVPGQVSGPRARPGR
ncbi:NUDIX domain-containing protein [Streptomyces sp. NPDC002680]|uniref:NUDIX domain-containing protein n=1 Tax=Streptomyces sp. NPDC002680 TaxID=3364659 RepID=UPI0036919040